MGKSFSFFELQFLHIKKKQTFIIVLLPIRLHICVYIYIYYRKLIFIYIVFIHKCIERGREKDREHMLVNIDKHMAWHNYALCMLVIIIFITWAWKAVSSILSAKNGKKWKENLKHTKKNECDCTMKLRRPGESERDKAHCSMTQWPKLLILLPTVLCVLVHETHTMQACGRIDNIP